MTDSETFPRFEYIQNGAGPSRIGTITTKHGVVHTPAFIFCATRGTIKGLGTHQVKEAGSQIILSNTYHLMLKPGGEYIENAGGIQRFTGWDGPMLTDSGGFQAFSLNSKDTAKVDELKRKYSCKQNKSGIIEISEEGIECKSYYDGTRFFLSPEKSIDVQIKLGADLIVVLDECTKFSKDKTYNTKALRRNERWADRSLAYAKMHKKRWQGLYGIIHGGTFNDLRRESAAFNNSREFFGHAIGGSLGRDKKEMMDVVEMSMEDLSKERPVHLLGIGGISDIFMGVARGIDTFDCVHPTRIARHGGALVKHSSSLEYINREYINLGNSVFKRCDLPIEESCDCKICKTYSRGYLNYLLSVKENIVFSLITYHNVYFMNVLMEKIRYTLKNNLDLKQLQKHYCG
ncbi:queuine tRNA-ribosyltransferase [Neorickettsia helminthoeca str. Oregon]|uniref:Queuine tRNA-ribosyltransferase n=1 Tax=Neorickettsia helminthoeca str. Oregon TaxID=1286528 RepID=X5HKZ7_9RICK|nr:tRNA guanosine(34) transglycosylase Tgt [Neorickettsia helminthoeca]AHX10995.1 queuine tRNA-ribosyltransferase [Neorickettsia helminthoeca str. Oregon]